MSTRLNAINAAIALVRAQDPRKYDPAREERARVRLRAAVLASHKQRKADLEDARRRRAR